MRLCFTLQTFILIIFFFSIQNLWYSTQPVLIFQHMVNNVFTELHNHLENRSFFVFLQYNPESSCVVFLSLFWSPFVLFYNEMVTVGKYIKTERVALLQPCRSMETINGVVILSMRFVNLLLPCYYFLYIFFRQVLFIRLKSTIGHAENAQFTSLGMQCLIQLQRV